MGTDKVSETYISSDDDGESVPARAPREVVTRTAPPTSGIVNTPPSQAAKPVVKPKPSPPPSNPTAEPPVAPRAARPTLSLIEIKEGEADRLSVRRITGAKILDPIRIPKDPFRWTDLELFVTSYDPSRFLVLETHGTKVRTETGHVRGFGPMDEADLLARYPAFAGKVPNY